MFEHLRSRRIDTLNLEAQEYRHAATGARHLHLAADDSNNCFMLAFRTLPEDSTGVAHVLEHTALCGSRRFPVRDPFFLMTRRSLNTFMNAFTGADWTAYPFASQNPKDFDNLLQVYLDAAFFPLLDELDFLQEGHRLEFEAPDDPNSALIYKGVVYNEMKGAMSAPATRLWHLVAEALYPTTPYHYNSGGDPGAIPDLGYADLRAFHARHYHPSNAWIATYGDLDVREHQEKIHAWALARFERRSPLPAIPPERRYSAARAALLHYAVDASEEAIRDKTHTVLGWLLGKTTDLRHTLEAQLLSGVLLDHSACPLRKALEGSALGTSPSELCGAETSQQEAMFLCGLEGSNPEQAEAVEGLVMRVLEAVADRGVPPGLAESVLHQMELAQREIRGGGYPYGLQLLAGALPIGLHGGDPIAALDLDPVLESLRTSIRDPDFIRGLTRRWLLDNPHRVRITMAPDPGLDAREAQALAARLAARRRGLSAAELEQIRVQAERLRTRQQAVQDPEVLPKVGLEDVPADIKVPTSRSSRIHGMPVTWFDQGTNGLVYQDLVVTLPQLESDAVDLLRLYSSCLTELGCGARDYLAAQEWQAAVSGGVNAGCALRAGVDDLGASSAYFRLSGNCLARNLAAVSELLRSTFLEARFDELERIRELIAQIRAAREASVTDRGHALAGTAACAGLGTAAALAHRWDGLAGIRQIKALDDALENTENLRALAARMADIHARIQGAPRQFLVIGEGRNHVAVAQSLEGQWQPQAGPADGVFAPAFEPRRVQEAWVTNTQVNFCARAYATVPAAHPDAAVLHVLGRFLGNGFLHRTIREQGGAYGCGAAYDGDSGSFHFYSYRDPRLAETLADFDAALRWLEAGPHEPRRLEEAILGVIAALDRPSSPAGEASKAFLSQLYGRTPEYRRRLRQRVLGVGIDDLVRVARTYLTAEGAHTAVVTGSRQQETCRALGLERLSL